MLEALAKLEGAKVEEDGKVVRYIFLKEGNAMIPGWESTLIGRAEVDAETLRLETNSVRRADALCRRVEAACHGLITHRTREKTEPAKLLAEREDPPPPGP